MCVKICICFFAEQRHFEIEKQLISTNEKLETETKNASEFRIQLVDIGW